MQLWTIQRWEAWELLQNTGRLQANPAFIDVDFLTAYDWLVAQMRQRLPAPASPCQYPLWAWYQYTSQAKPKPDLRHTSLLPRSSRGVVIECHLPDSQVLLSDFDLWHYVLNRCYLGANEAQITRFEASSERYNPARYQCLLRHSWERIFDLDWVSPGVASPKAEKAIQATFWELRLEQVRSAREFIAR